MQKDYDLNEKIIPAKVDSLEHIQRKLDYQYYIAQRIRDDIYNGKLIWILYDVGAADEYQVYFLLGNTSGWLFHLTSITVMIGLDPYTVANWLAWDSQLCLLIYPLIGAQFVDLDTDLNYSGIAVANRVESYLLQYFGDYRLVEVTSVTTMANFHLFLKTWYETIENSILPLPLYYSEREFLTYDEYQQKMIENKEYLESKNKEKEEEIEEIDPHLWFPGDFPQTPLFHAMFVDGHTFYIPNQFTLDEYTHNQISDQFPDLLFLQCAWQQLCWIKLVLSRHSLVAYGKESDYEPYLQGLSYREMANLYIITEQNERSWTKGYANYGMRVELINKYLVRGRGIELIELKRNYGLMCFTFVSTNTPEQMHSFIRGISALIDGEKWRTELTPIAKLGGV